MLIKPTNPKNFKYEFAEKLSVMCRRNLGGYTCTRDVNHSGPHQSQSGGFGQHNNAHRIINRTWEV